MKIMDIMLLFLISDVNDVRNLVVWSWMSLFILIEFVIDLKNGLGLVWKCEV